MPPPTKRRRFSPTLLEEIAFDPSLRHEYLTGFHKRKLQRTKAAQEAAEKRARQGKIEARKRMREGRKKELEQRLKVVEEMIRPATTAMEGDGEGDISSEGGEREEEKLVVEPVDHEAEYVDEDKYTSVVVEEMDVTREGLRRANEVDEPEVEGKELQTAQVDVKEPKRTWTKEKPKDAKSKPKTKRKKFRYESKAERRTTRDKERSKNRAQAHARREQ